MELIDEKIIFKKNHSKGFNNNRKKEKLKNKP